MMRSPDPYSKHHLTLSFTPSRFKIALENTHSERRLVRQNSLLSELLETIPLKFKKSLRKIVDFYEQQISESQSQILKLSQDNDALRTKAETLACDLIEKQSQIANLSGQLHQIGNMCSLNCQINHAREDKLLHELKWAKEKLATLEANVVNSTKKINEFARALETKSKQLNQVNDNNAQLQKQIEELSAKLKEAKILSIKKVVSEQKLLTIDQTQIPNKFSIFKFKKNGGMINRPQAQSSSPLKRQNSISRRNKSPLEAKDAEEEDEYGKEKVVQKKKMRKLLQEFLFSQNKQQASNRLRLISDEIGLKMHQLQVLSSIF